MIRSTRGRYIVFLGIGSTIRTAGTVLGLTIGITLYVVVNVLIGYGPALKVSNRLRILGSIGALDVAASVLVDERFLSWGTAYM